jgi:short-subunit dehydrogenase
MKRRKAITWAGQVAVVTGASSGIGLAVTKVLIAREVRVAMVARSRERLEEAVLALGPERAAAFPLDVSDRAALARLPARVFSHFGRLDLVVHGAGVNHRGPVSERTLDELGAILDANLVAPVLLTRAALPFLRPGGAIVNIASLAGKVPIPGEAAYSASKAGLRAFARALENEVRGRRVTVSTICPGPVDTAFLGDARDVPALVFSQPMNTAERVAGAVLECIESGREEIDMPALSGMLATLGYLSPTVLALLRPFLETRGARNKERFITSRAPCSR